MKDIVDYNENGNIIHLKASNGYEWWREYDEKGNVTYHRNSNGYEIGVRK